MCAALSPVHWSLQLNSPSHWPSFCLAPQGHLAGAETKDALALPHILEEDGPTQKSTHWATPPGRGKPGKLLCVYETRLQLLPVEPTAMAAWPSLTPPMDPSLAICYRVNAEVTRYASCHQTGNKLMSVPSSDLRVSRAVAFALLAGMTLRVQVGEGWETYHMPMCTSVCLFVYLWLYAGKRARTEGNMSRNLWICLHVLLSGLWFSTLSCAPLVTSGEVWLVCRAVWCPICMSPHAEPRTLGTLHLHQFARSSLSGNHLTSEQ